MRRLLMLFPVSDTEARRAAHEIRSLFGSPDFLGAAAYAAFLAIGLPAALAFLSMIGGAL